MHKGRRDLADDVVTALDRRLIGSILKFIVQIWHLYKADILWLTGRRAEAIRTAERGFNASSSALLSPSFAGPYSRWVALTCRASNNLTRARNVLQGLVANLEHFDVMDRVEILCSMRFINYFLNAPSPEIDEAIQERVRGLPPAISDHLERLGILFPKG